MIAKKIEGKEGETLYASVDLKYAYGQVPLDQETAKHCNFQIVVGNATGTYRFLTRYYELTIMLTEFQKIMDKVLQKHQNTFALIDNILIVTKGIYELRLKRVEEVLGNSSPSKIRKLSYRKN